MWSENCQPLTLCTLLREELSSAERMQTLATLAHFYIFEQTSDQYIQELESLLDVEPQETLLHAHLSFLKACKKQMVGDWEGSTCLLESALDLYTEHGHVRGVVEASIGMATVYSQRLGPSHGIGLLEQVREKISEHNLPSICEAYMLNQFAVAHLMVELYSFAELYGRQALAKSASFPKQNEGVLSRNAIRVYAASAWTLSYTLVVRGQFDEALRIAEESLSVVQPLKIPYWDLRMLQVIVYALIDSGNNQTAIERLTAQLDFPPPTLPSIYDDCYALLGVAYANENQFARAEPLLVRAIELYTEVNSLGSIYRRCLAALAALLEQEERYEKAVAYYKLIQSSMSQRQHLRTTMELEHLTEVYSYELKRREATLLKSSNERLSEANALLQQSINEQTEMIRLVAHDVYNPLTSIKIRTKLMTEHIKAGNTARSLTVLTAIKESADFIGDIVSQFQIINQLDRDETHSEHQVMQLEDEIQLALGRNQTAATDKQITVEFVQTVSARIYANQIDMRRILDNILSNAIKYSHPDSSVEIKLSAVDDSNVQIEVTDQGVGIDPEERHKLFSKFGRLDASRPTANEGSSGLGLYIVQALLHKVGGEISAHSAGLEQGSTFKITLPTV